MNQISTVAQGVIVAIGTGYNVYATVANAMDAVDFDRQPEERSCYCFRERFC